MSFNEGWMYEFPGLFATLHMISAWLSIGPWGMPIVRTEKTWENEDLRAYKMMVVLLDTISQLIVYFLNVVLLIGGPVLSISLHTIQRCPNFPHVNIHGGWPFAKCAA
jgi:hypothetical protein